MEHKLKKFILSELRGQGEIELSKIIYNSTIKYTEAINRSVSSDTCTIYISNKQDYNNTKQNLSYKNKIKDIVGYAKNTQQMSGSYGQPGEYYLECLFEFDLNHRSDADISNIDEDLGSLELDKQKMISRYHTGNDNDGALSAAKSLLESAFKIYLDEHNISYTKDDDFPTLQKLVFSNIETNKNYYQRIISGIKTICSGVNETRNKEGDGHGSNPKTRPTINSEMVKIILETTISATSFILSQKNN